MNFYIVKIGRTSKKGLFIENYSFVCKTDEEKKNTVYNHFTLKYYGFDVVIDEIKDFVELPKTIDYSKETRELNIKISELNKQLQGSKTQLYKGKIKFSYFPQQAKDWITSIKEKQNEISILKSKSKELIVKHLEINNCEFCEWFRSGDGFSSDYDTFDYEARLIGELIIIPTIEEDGA